MDPTFVGVFEWWIWRILAKNLGLCPIIVGPALNVQKMQSDFPIFLLWVFLPNQCRWKVVKTATFSFVSKISFYSWTWSINHFVENKQNKAMKRCFRTCVDRVVKEPILEHLRHFEFSEEEDEIDCHIGPDAEEELKNYEYYHLDDYTTISKILKLLAGWLDQMKTLPEHAVLDHPPVLPSEQTVTNCNFTNKGFFPLSFDRKYCCH